MSEQTDQGPSIVRVVNVGEDNLLSMGTSDGHQGETSMNEPGGRIVTLALAEGATGERLLNDSSEVQAAGETSIPQESNLIQHIQIQPLGEEISQGETITLSLEEAQQLLQQHIVAGEGVEGVQPGIYQILSSGLTKTETVDGQMFVTAGDNVSLLQPASAESLTGFESLNPSVLFNSSTENLQTQLEHENTCTNHETNQDDEKSISVSEVGATPTNPEESAINNSLSSSSFTLVTVPSERSDTATLNQSVPTNKSEKVIHIDFHVNHSGNLLQMVNQTEANYPVPTVKTEISDSPIKGAGLQLRTVPITAPTSAVVPVSSGLGMQVNIQSTSTDEPHPTGVENNQVSEQAKQETKQSNSVRFRSKQIKPVTPKKPPEIRPDLSKPIEVKEEMEVIVRGKKCMLAVDPDTGRLTAYPILPPEGKRGRGRPKKTEQEKKKQETGTAGVLTPETESTSSAAEGLLELSNTGPDGIRRSGRVRRKAKTLDDYDILEGSSDDEGGAKEEDDQSGKRVRLESQQDYIPPISFPMPAPVKRGRGRPRRYPPPGQTTTTQIPTMIIPSGDGQTIMMAPIQGLGNLQAFQEQVKNISILPKSWTGATITTTNITDNTPQLLNTSTSFSVSQPVHELDGTPAGTGAPLIGNAEVTGETTGNTIVIHSKFPTQDVTSIVVENPVVTQPAVVNSALTQPVVNPVVSEPEEHAEPELADSLNTDEDNETREAVDTLEDVNRITVKNGDNQPTIIQIPENLLPMFMQKKEPLKLGLKSSEDELEKMKCIKCNFQAYYEQQYQTHIATHTDDVSKCKACNFVTFDKEDLLTHFRENHPRCICNVCDFMAEHAYVIKRHMMRHNADGCRCDICGKCYKDQYVLKMHIKMVHMPAEVLFECMICSKKFTRKAHLKRHLRIHDPEKPFKCPHCIYRGCEKSDISKHLLIHEEPKHICEVCGKAFRHVKNKELHLKRHNGQRDYKCGVCDFYGYTFTDIRKHIERKHTDSKTIICDKCGSAFKTDWHLREHQRLGNCEMYMIEQALAIATSDGGTSKATIQIPTSLSMEGHQMQINGQNIVLDGSTGQFNIKVEQVKLPGENIALTEDQIQAAVSQNQIIDGEPEELIMEVTGSDVPVKLSHVGDVCLSDEEEENEEDEETEDDIHALERNIHGIVSEMSD